MQTLTLPSATGLAFSSPSAAVRPATLGDPTASAASASPFALVMEDRLNNNNNNNNNNQVATQTPPNPPANVDDLNHLANANGASLEATAQEQARLLVSTTFLMPLFAQLRHGTGFADDSPFAPSSAEKQFQRMLDQSVADDLVKRMDEGPNGFAPVRQLVDEMLKNKRPAGTQTPEFERHA